MQQLSRLAVVAVTALFAQSADATSYDFSWSGDSFSATGIMELSDAIGVGDPFDSGDVLALKIDLFDGGVFVGMVGFPSQSFDVLEGTRNESSLSITDLLLDVVGPGATLFGCEAPGCLFGRVLFQTPSTLSGQVEFGTTMAAQESFVFTVPEPSPQLLQALALFSIVGMSQRKLRRASRKNKAPFQHHR